MNCQIFETVVNDIAREQMMEAKAREEALAHSVDCEACALKLSLERRLTFGLRALAAEMTSVSASARVEQQLLEAFRCQTSLLAKTPQANRSRYWLVAAAVILIAFGIAGMKLGLDVPSQTEIKTADKTVGQTTQVSSVTIERIKTEPTPEVTPVVKRPRPKQSVPRSRKFSSVGNAASLARGTSASDVGDADESEVTTQFLPFSYVSPASLQDGGQLVRVELPRSAMVSFGLPVNMERYSEKVKADVLVSADGLARAIRFVQ